MALTWQSTILVAMTGLKQSSAIAAYLGQANSMRRSHDENGAIQMNMCSKYGFGIIISEEIIDYALNVMLLVQYDSRRVVIVSSWGDV